jgi:RNA polymerase sigma-70 factor (ECF subfamily)
MMSGVSDTVLVKRCLAGDQQAFGVLIDRYQTPIYNLARKSLRDELDAEDVTQTVFMKAYEHLDAYNPQYKFFSWIYRIAINESINHAKRKRDFEPFDETAVSVQAVPATVFSDTSSSGHATGAAAGIDVEVQDGLMQLTAEDRAIVLLKHFEGFSYKQIGFIMDIPSKTVKSRLYSARQRLKDILRRERAHQNG